MEPRLAEGKRVSRDLDTRSVSLLEQKRKVVSSSIDVPHARLDCVKPLQSVLLSDLAAVHMQSSSRVYDIDMSSRK